MTYNDHEFDPITPEELAQIAQDEEFSRKIRREIARVQRGEASEDIQADLEEQEDIRKEEERVKREKEKSDSNLLQLFITGNILVKKGVVKYYRGLISIAVMFLFSIMVMFLAFHLDVRQILTERKIQLLRERSIRLQELRYSLTRQSAITKELQLRGIELYDLSKPNEIIED